MINKIEEEHLDAVLALNNLHQLETSALDQPTLKRMAATAFATLQVGAGRDGFLLAFDHDASYDGVNFRWFQARCASFIYVDRVVVAADRRGTGLARRLYETLFERARAARIDAVCCEVNIAPPNPGSDAFHARMGFREVGRARLDDRAKTVRYLVKRLGADGAPP